MTLVRRLLLTSGSTGCTVDFNLNQKLVSIIVESKVEGPILAGRLTFYFNFKLSPMDAQCRSHSQNKSGSIDSHGKYATVHWQLGPHSGFAIGNF